MRLLVWTIFWPHVLYSSPAVTCVFGSPILPYQGLEHGSFLAYFPRTLYCLSAKQTSCLQVLGVLAQIKTEKDSVDALIQPVETSDRLFQEIQALQKQVNELESKLDVQAQGAKSLEEIISELKILERKRCNTLCLFL